MALSKTCRKPGDVPVRPRFTRWEFLVGDTTSTNAQLLREDLEFRGWWVEKIKQGCGHAQSMTFPLRKVEATAQT
jgi:hypothetical protein